MWWALFGQAYALASNKVVVRLISIEACAAGYVTSRHMAKTCLWLRYVFCDKTILLI